VIATSTFEELRLRRLKLGLSQSELGNSVGMPQSQVARIENGSTDIRLSTLLEISRALGLEAVLIPQALLPAVRQLLAEHDRPELTNPAAPRRLLGAEPEDADGA
jgi:transcriptional regulator with XRE-family HTH domain